jgi:two-component system phosphate regulon sensor histidine kinase PhoR
VSEIASRRSLIISIVFAIGIVLVGLASGVWIWLALPIAVGVVALGSIFQRELESVETDLARKTLQNDTLGEIARTQKSAVDAFADGLDIGIFVCDERAHIAYANRFAQLLFGFENPLGRSLLAVTLSVELEQLALSAGDEKRVIETEITFSFPKERICLARAWTTNDPPERVYLSLVEITELRRMERVRKDFVANVSHELRTPMTVIRVYAETMIDDDSKELRKKYLPRIISEVDRLTSITHDLLVLSTSESSPVRKGPCELGGIVRYAINLLTPQAEEKGLKLTYEGPEDLDIEANASQMTQVVVNLVENALKYTNEGGVDIRLEDQGEYIRFDVTDTGIGIPDEHLPRLFERFYRVDKARSRAGGGTGLGLSIVKHIVEAHGGSIHVDSAQNRGTTFSVVLPKGDFTSMSVG